MPGKNVWENVYKFSLALFIFEEVLRRSTYMDFSWSNKLCLILMAVSCCGAALKLAADFFGRRLSLREILFMGIPALACVYLAAAGKTGVFMFLLLFSAAAHDVDYGRIAEVFAFGLLGAVLFILFSGLIGFIRETDLPQLRDGAFRSRLGCGFEYYYMASHYVFFSVLVCLYARREKISFGGLAGLLLLVLYVYDRTDTKMPFYLSLLALGICIVLRLVPFLRGYHLLYGLAAVLSYPFAAAAILFITVFLPSNELLWGNLNEVMTGRLNMNLNGYLNFGLKLFGNNIVWQTSEEGYNLVDSSYLMYLYEYGIIFLLAALGVCVLLGVYCHKRRDTYYAFLTCIIAVYAVFDNWWMRPECNLFFMAYPYVSTVLRELKEQKRLVEEPGPETSVAAEAENGTAVKRVSLK